MKNKAAVVSVLKFAKGERLADGNGGNARAAPLANTVQAVVVDAGRRRRGHRRIGRRLSHGAAGRSRPRRRRARSAGPMAGERIPSQAAARGPQSHSPGAARSARPETKCHAMVDAPTQGTDLVRTRYYCVPRNRRFPAPASHHPVPAWLLTSQSSLCPICSTVSTTPKKPPSCTTVAPWSFSPAPAPASARATHWPARRSCRRPLRP